MNDKSTSYSYSRYIEKFEQTKEEAKNLLIPIDERMFRRQPSANAWCVGECFSHLVETGKLYLDKIEEGVRGAKIDASYTKNPMHLRFHMQWFVNYLEPPVSVKSKTPGPFQPVEYASLDKEEVLENFLNLQERYINQLELAETKQLNLSGIKVSNPLISFIKMTVAECIAVSEAHQRRHIEQARKILEIL